MIEEVDYKNPYQTGRRLINQYNREIVVTRSIEEITLLEKWLIEYIHQIEKDFTLKNK